MDSNACNLFDGGTFWLGSMANLEAIILAKIPERLNEVMIQFRFPIDDDDKPPSNHIPDLLKVISQTCKQTGWLDLQRQTDRFRVKALDTETPLHGEAIATLAEDLNDAFMEKLRRVIIYVVPEADTEIFQSASSALLGGITLSSALSQCESEFNLAGKCLALQVSTASVVHSMRAVESSLHVLCNILNIAFSAPVELQHWKVLEDKIKAELTKAEAASRSQQKTDRLQKLGKLLTAIAAFRVAWRNHVAHAREKYETEEARKILIAVGDYLIELNSGI